MGAIGAQFLPQDFDECMASVQAAEDAGYSHALFVAQNLEILPQIAAGPRIKPGRRLVKQQYRRPVQ